MERPVSRDISDIDDPRLVKALAHPIRVRIMSILEEGTRTPKQLAEELGLPLENVSYHVRTLKDFGFIKLEKTRQVRGAVEHHYKAAAKPRITHTAWEQIPGIVKEAMIGASLSAIGETVNDAAVSDGFERSESVLVRHTFPVDDQAYAEMSAILDEALERIEEAAAASRKRLGRGEGSKATVVAMLFDSPDAAVKTSRGRRSRTRSKAPSAS